jgi:hypothetical protein
MKKVQNGKSGMASAIALNITAAGVLPQWQNSGRRIKIFICEHKNIEMSTSQFKASCKDSKKLQESWT